MQTPMSCAIPERGVGSKGEACSTEPWEEELATTWGIVRLLGQGEAVQSVRIPPPPVPLPPFKRLSSTVGGEVTEAVGEALEGHESAALRQIPLDPRGGPLSGGGPGKSPTAFQWRVWEVLRRIPCGRLMTYGEVARAIGKPNASRAVAKACGANPLPLFIPCHRVIGADGTLTGFSAGLAWKQLLLAREGRKQHGKSTTFGSAPARARLLENNRGKIIR